VTADEMKSEEIRLDGEVKGVKEDAVPQMGREAILVSTEE
jgi:hypothetical protein